MGISRLKEIVQCFKRECQSKGWKTSEHEDLVEAGNNYHNFLWVRSIHPSTFKEIAETHKCAIKEGVSYRVVDVAYTAWLFSEPLTDKLIQTIDENPAIAKRTAMYDLNGEHLDKLICLKSNKTDSIVFRQFESFLDKKIGVQFKLVKELLSKQV